MNDDNLATCQHTDLAALDSGVHIRMVALREAEDRCPLSGLSRVACAAASDEASWQLEQRELVRSAVRAATTGTIHGKLLDDSRLCDLARHKGEFSTVFLQLVTCRDCQEAIEQRVASDGVAWPWPSVTGEQL